MTPRRSTPLPNVYEAAAEVLLRESGCTVRKWRTSNTGRAAVRADDWGIEVPRPRGPVSFAVFAHEVGHQWLHRSGSRPRYREEVEAWDFALAQFDRFNLPGREKAEQDAARSIGYAFLKAIRRSRRLVKEILAEFPEWWALAEKVDVEALARPSMSDERRGLDQ